MYSRVAFIQCGRIIEEILESSRFHVIKTHHHMCVVNPFHLSLPFTLEHVHVHVHVRRVLSGCAADLC